MRSPAAALATAATAASLLLLSASVDVASSFAAAPPPPLVASTVPAGGSSAPPRSRASAAAPRRASRGGGGGSRAALSMGLRSFIKGKLGKREGGDGDGDAGRRKKARDGGGSPADGGRRKGASPASAVGSSPSSDPAASASASASASAAPPPPSEGGAAAAPPPARPPGPIRQPLPEDMPAAPRPPKRYESVQERIRRVKSGEMTDAEKAAFLHAALSRPLDPRGAPVSAVPGGGGENDGADERPSPFARETLWSTVLGHGDGAVPSVGGGGGGGASPSRSAAASSRSGGRHLPYETLDAKAKRAYYDMVTNPDRFRSYGYGGDAAAPPPAAEMPLDVPPLRTHIPSEDLIDNPSEEPYAPSSFVEEYRYEDEAAEAAEFPDAAAAAAASVDPHEEGDDEKHGEKDGKDSSWHFFDLGTRLEAAAHVREEQDQKARAEVEARRAEEKRRRAEIDRLRDEETQRRMREHKKREAEMNARRREEDERKRREEEERRRREEDRLREIREAQDAYWAKKLAEEREKRETTATAKAARTGAEETREEKVRLADEARATLREEERAREDPHEGEILKEAQIDDLHERERNWQITEEQSARIAHEEPRSDPPDVSASSFVSEQQRRTAEVERMRREGEDRLRSLNSPLPAPGSAPPPPTPRGPAAAPSAGGGSSVRQVASLASFLNQKGGSGDGGGGGGEVPVPRSAPAPAPRLSLSEMTRLKKDVPAGGGGGGGGRDGGGARAPSLSEMTRLRKDGDGSDAVTAGGARRRVRQKLPLSDDARSGPVRQRPTLGDRDADEDDDLLRSGRGKAMSIGDYMRRGDGADGGGGGGVESKKEEEQKRSKMWGIDIDKIL